MTKELHFTQYLRPYGTPRDEIIDRPEEIVDKAEAVKKAGGRFEMELLTTGEVSMTVERDGDDDETDVLAAEICANGARTGRRSGSASHGGV